MLSRWKSTWWHFLPRHRPGAGGGCFSGDKAAAAAAAGWPKTAARWRHVDNRTNRLDSVIGDIVVVAVVVFNMLENHLSSENRPSTSPFDSTGTCLALGVGESAGLSALWCSINCND